MNLSDMQKSVGKASALLRALANERRLMILCQLVEGEKSVGALAESLDIAQAMISQQLSILRREELVCFRREGSAFITGSTTRQQQGYYRSFMIATARNNCQACETHFYQERNYGKEDCIYLATGSEETAAG